MRLNFQRIGTGPALVLIHGIGSHWQVWQPVLDRLAPHRDIVALDLPGFGASPPPPPGAAPGVDSLTRIVAEFLGELGLERPHVGGNSLGGWIAIELARRGRAASATALSPAGFHTSREAIYERLSLLAIGRAARALAPRAHRILRSKLARRVAFAQLVARPDALPPDYAAAAVRALADAPWFDETLIAITSDRFEPGAIDAPVTVAWGAKDRLLLPRQARRVTRAIPGARVRALPGCGHVPMFDDPALVAGVLLDGSGF